MSVRLMTQLRFSLFQQFQATLHQVPIIDFRSVKGRALLAYLAIEQTHPHQRESLAGLLWPDEPERRARRNLSQTLLEVRNAIKDRQAEPPFLLIASQSIAFNPASDHWIDAAEFQKHLHTVQTHAHADPVTCDVCIPALRQAADLYQGQFLAEFSVAGSDLFETWLLTQREKYHQQALETLLTLSRHEEEAANYTQAQYYIRNLLALEPWHEDAHQQLMRLLALDGQRSAALAQYETCRRLLEEELGVPPSAETETLYHKIRDGELKSTVTKSASWEVAGSASSTPPPNLTTVQPPFQAIAATPHFVGRTEEIEILQRTLTQPKRPLVALVGMGGVGKSTLAAEVAHTLRSHFQDGVLWANAATSTPLDILTTWSRAYHHDYSGLPDLASRAAAVRSLLAEKRVLIILDNIEQVGEVKPLLPGSQTCAVLLTTRDLDVAHALNAHVILVEELLVPDGRRLLAHILGEDRVSAEEQAAQEICHLLQNLPLAVEIVAQRLKSRPRQRLLPMAARLQDERYRLGLEISDLAVRTSFEISWAALDEDLRRLFAWAALFEGRPFQGETLAALTQIDPDTVEDRLFALTILSLMQEVEETQFRQHALLADFARAKLKDVEEAYTQLSDYYLTFVQENQKNYPALQGEWRNILGAISVAQRQQRGQQIIAYAAALTEAWHSQGRYTDARQVYAWVAEAATQLEDAETQMVNLLRWGRACIEQNDFDEAQTHLEEALNYCRILQADAEQAEALYLLARIAGELNQFDEAEEALTASLAIRVQQNDLRGIAAILYRRAAIYYDTYADDQAEQVAQEALNLQETTAEQKPMLPTLRLLALVKGAKKDYSQAETYAHRALKLSETLQDNDERTATLYTLFILQKYQGNFEAARTLAEECLPLFQRMGNRKAEGAILHELSVIDKEEGAYQPALERILAGLQIYRQIHYRLGCVRALLHLGEVYTLLEQPALGQEAWLEAEQIAQSLGNRTLLETVQQKLQGITGI